jgi:hypothetical protein
LNDFDERVSVTRSVLTSGRNLQALDYWNQRRGERIMPARADLDPAGIVEILPHVILLDVQGDPLDFRYRLIGTVIASNLNRNLTGKWMRDIPHQAPPSLIHDACRRVVEARHPISSTVPYVGPNKEFFSAEDVIMPLSADGETVDMLFVTVEYLLKL